MVQRYTFPQQTVVGNAGDPTLAQDLATKNYVDTRPAGSLSVNGTTVLTPNLQSNAIQLGVSWTVSGSNINGAIRLVDVATIADQEIAARIGAQANATFISPLIAPVVVGGTTGAVTLRLDALDAAASANILNGLGPVAGFVGTTGSALADLPVLNYTTAGVGNTTLVVNFANTVTLDAAQALFGAGASSVSGSTVYYGNSANAGIFTFVGDVAGAVSTLDYQWAKNSLLTAGTITKTFSDANQTITLTGTSVSGSAAIFNIGTAYISDNTGILTKVLSTTANLSNVTGSVATNTDFGAANITTTPWPPVIPAGLNNFFIGISSADNSTWGGVGAIQASPPGITSIAWIKPPASNLSFTDAKVWFLYDAISTGYVGTTQALAQANPVTTTVWPELQLAYSSDSFGGAKVTALTQPFIDSRIATNIGSITQRFVSPTLSNAVSINLLTSNVVVQVNLPSGALALANALDLLLSSSAAYVGTTINTLPNLPVFAYTAAGSDNLLEIVLQPSVTLETANAKFIGAGANTVFTTSSAGAPTFTFQSAPQTEILRLAGTVSSGVSSLQALRGDVLLTSTDDSVGITVSGQNINLRATGGGSGSVPLPVINFTASAAGGANQQFTNAQLASYTSSLYISVTVNGSTLNSSNYSLNSTTLTITSYLSPNANVQVQPSAGGGSGSGGWSIGGNSFSDTGPKLLGSITNNQVSLIANNVEAMRLTQAAASAPLTLTGLPTTSGYSVIGYWTNSQGAYAAYSNGGQVGATFYIQATGATTFSPGPAYPSQNSGINCGVQYDRDRMLFGFVNITGGDQALWIQSASSINTFTRQAFTYTTGGNYPQPFDIDLSLDRTKLAALVQDQITGTATLLVCNNYSPIFTTLTFAPLLNLTPSATWSSVQWIDNTNVVVTNSAGGASLVNTTTGVVTVVLPSTGAPIQPIESTLINGNFYFIADDGLHYVNRSNPTSYTSTLIYAFSSPPSWGTEDIYSTSSGVFYYGTNSNSSFNQLTFSAGVAVPSGQLILGDGASKYNAISAANGLSPTGFTVGTAGEVLTSSGAGFSYRAPASPPLLSYRLTTTVSIPNTTDTTINFDFITGEIGNVGLTYSNGIFTAQAVSVYLVSYQVAWQQNATGARAHFIQVSGVEQRIMLEDRAASTDFSGVTSTGLWLASAFETAQFRVWQNSGSTLTLGPAGGGGYAAGFAVTISFLRVG